MLFIVGGVIWALWLVLLAFAPKAALLSYWFIFFCYPQAMFLGVLPYNAGFDDICILLLVGRMLLYRPPEGDRPWATGVVLIALAAMVMDSISSLVGALHESVLLPIAIKTSLKAVVLLLLTVSLGYCIRTERDIRRHLIAFSWACVLAYAIAILCYFYPNFSDPWQVQTEDWEYRAGTAAARTYGPFNGSAEIGGIVCVSLPLALGMLLTRPRQRGLLLSGLALLAGSVLVVLVSKTRAGMLGLAIMFVVLVIASRKRLPVLVMSLVFVGLLSGWIAVSYSGEQVLAGTEARLTPERLQSDAAIRMELWGRIPSQVSADVLLFGIGSTAYFHKWQMSPHNGYLDALFLWGVGGVIVFAIIFGAGIKWAVFLRRHDDHPTIRATSFGWFWSIVAIAGMALVSDPWFMTSYRVSALFFLVLLRTACLRVHERAPTGEGELLEQDWLAAEASVGA